MAHTYRASYQVPATNVTPAQLQAALAAVPRDLDTEALLGLSVAPGNDQTTIAGNVVTRSILYDSAPGPLGDPYTRDALQNFYTETFSRALSSRVTALPVVFA